MSSPKSSISPHFSNTPIKHAVRLTLPRRIQGKETIAYKSQLRTSLDMLLATPKYVGLSRKIRLTPKTHEKPTKLNTSKPVLCPHSLSPNNSLITTPPLSPQTSYLMLQARSVDHLPDYFPPPKTPHFYTITKYMMSRAGAPRGLQGWKSPQSHSVTSTEPSQVHTNKLIDAFLRRFERKQ